MVLEERDVGDLTAKSAGKCLTSLTEITYNSVSLR